MSSFRFRKKTEYGMMMMSLLAKYGKGGVVSVRTMQQFGLPRSFLVKIARDLIKAKLVVAKEGRGGGYSLTSEATKVTLKQVVEAIDGDKKRLMAEHCLHRKMMSKLTEEIGLILSKYRLSEFGD